MGSTGAMCSILRGSSWAWYVEHAHTKWEMVKRTVPTLWYLLFPNRYWRRLGMEAPRSLKRFVLWVSAMMLAMHLVTAVGLMIGNHVYVLGYNQATRAWMATQSQAIQTSWQKNIYDTDSVDYWYPLIGESLLYPAVNTWFYFEPVSVYIGIFGLGLTGVSVMWLVLFCAFPTTRKRSKLRLIHVVRAMVVGVALPLLIYELGRVLDVFMFVNETWGPYGWIDNLMGAAMSIAPLALVIWIQWFWISAVRVGWKVKANWFELFLVMVASFFGTIIGLVSSTLPL